MHVSPIVSYNNVQASVTKQKKKIENRSYNSFSAMEKLEISPIAKKISKIIQKKSFSDQESTEKSGVLNDIVNDRQAFISDKLKEYTSELDIPSEEKFEINISLKKSVSVDGAFEKRELLEDALNLDEEFKTSFDEMNFLLDFVEPQMGMETSFDRSDIQQKTKNSYFLKHENGEMSLGAFSQIKSYCFKNN